MAWTQDDLDTISKAIAQGARRVRFQTHEVEYQSMAEMMKAREAIQASLGQSPSAGVILTEFLGGY